MTAVATAPSRVFEFDAARRWFQRSMRDAERGIAEPGWWGNMADRLSAADPSLTHHTSRMRVGRMRGTMIDAYTADRIAIALGVHPCEIWPKWFEMAGVEIIARLRAGVA